MKKYLSLFFAALLCVMMAVAVSAADVYVKEGGAGDGSSAESPLGSLTAAIYAVENGGTIHIIDTFTQTEEFTEPEHAGDIVITGGEIVYNTNTWNRYILSGPGSTTFENVTITAADPSKGLVMAAQFNPIIIGEGVTTPTKTYLLGGHQLDNMGTDTEVLMAEKGMALDKDSYVTVKSGTFHVVSGYSRGASTAMYTGTSHLDIQGGTINLLLGGPCNGSAGQNAEINVSGGTVTELMTAGDDTRRLNGDCTVNISGGKIFTFTICNIMGRGTVNYTGGEIVQVMERMVADRLLEYVTDGTIHLNVDPSIDAGLISLYFDTVNGESPFVATEAPETTEAPAETTEAPVETTEAPVETTEEVEETEEEPEKTEAPVETTTAAPAATTERT